MYSVNKYLVYPIVDWQRQTTTGYQVGFPIRKSMDQRVLSPPHGLSQSATSFIASYRQGIHQTPFSRLIRSSECMTGNPNSAALVSASTDPHHMFPKGLAKALAHRLRDMLSPAFRSRQYRQRVWHSQTQWSVY